MTREWPYERFDITTGCTLRITRSADMNGHALVRTEGGATRVPAAALPAVAAALYEAAGLPAPVILERPAIVPGAVTEGGITAGREGRAICVGLPPGPSTRRLDPAGARRLAVALAVYADEVDAEPDPAEVEELATVIRTELYPPSEALGLRPAEQDRTAARAALRWMKQREADHG